jgi:hypothetical protein
LSISFNSSTATEGSRRLAHSLSSLGIVELPSELSTLLSAEGFGATCGARSLSLHILRWGVNPYQAYTNGLSSGMSVGTTVVSVTASDCTGMAMRWPLMLNGKPSSLRLPQTWQIVCTLHSGAVDGLRSQSDTCDAIAVRSLERRSDIRAARPAAGEH